MPGACREHGPATDERAKTVPVRVLGVVRPPAVLRGQQMRPQIDELRPAGAARVLGQLVEWRPPPGPAGPPRQVLRVDRFLVRRRDDDIGDPVGREPRAPLLEPPPDLRDPRLRPGAAAGPLGHLLGTDVETPAVAAADGEVFGRLRPQPSGHALRHRFVRQQARAPRPTDRGDALLAEAGAVEQPVLQAGGEPEQVVDAGPPQPAGAPPCHRGKADRGPLLDLRIERPAQPAHGRHVRRRERSHESQHECAIVPGRQDRPEGRRPGIERRVMHRGQNLK